MSIPVAILLALAVVAAQVLHGGMWVPALMVPSYMLLIAAAIAALFCALRNRTPPRAGAVVGVLIFVSYLIWRCTHAPDSFLGRVELGHVLAAGLVFMIACGALTTTSSRWVVLGILGFFVLAQAIVGFIQFAKGGLVAPLGWFAQSVQMMYETKFQTRAHGLFLNPNQFSWLMGWGAIFATSIACWGRVNVLTRVILVYLALVFIGADMLSGSRGGIIGLLCGLGAFSFASLLAVIASLRRGRVGMALGAILLIALFAGVGIWVYSSNWVAQGRLDSIAFPDVRGFLLEHAWRQFQASPLLGMGPDMFIYAARLYRTGYQAMDAVFAHDDWLQTLVDYGFVGLAIAVLATAVLLGGGLQRFLDVVRHRARFDERPFSNSAAITLGALAASVAFCVHSFVDFNMHVPANAMLAAVTLGFLATGMEFPAEESLRNVQSAVMKIVSFLAIAALGSGLAVYAWQYSAADYDALLAANRLAEGNVKATLALTEAGLLKRPRDAALLELRGKALYAYESSLQFEGANNSDPDKEPTEEGIKVLTPAERLKVFQSSADAFTEALKEQPLEREYHVELAKALAEVDKPQEAERHLIDAIALDPMHPYAYGAYGDRLHEVENLPRALRIYQLGCQFPEAAYCGEGAQDVLEEMSPPVEDDAGAVAAPEDESGAQGSDTSGGHPSGQ